MSALFAKKTPSAGDKVNDAAADMKTKDQKRVSGFAAMMQAEIKRKL